MAWQPPQVQRPKSETTGPTVDLPAYSDVRSARSVRASRRSRSGDHASRGRTSKSRLRLRNGEPAGSAAPGSQGRDLRSQEHTSELHPHFNLISRLLL